MMPTDRELVMYYVPDSVKQMSRQFQMHKLATHITGLTDFSPAKVAAYLGGRIAARNIKWRPVADGLLALHELQG